MSNYNQQNNDDSSSIEEPLQLDNQNERQQLNTVGNGNQRRNTYEQQQQQLQNKTDSQLLYSIFLVLFIIGSLYTGFTLCKSASNYNFVNYEIFSTISSLISKGKTSIVSKLEMFFKLIVGLILLILLFSCCCKTSRGNTFEICCRAVIECNALLCVLIIFGVIACLITVVSIEIVYIAFQSQSFFWNELFGI